MKISAATYQDGFGMEVIQIISNGSFLETEIRGVKFSGNDFNSLSPISADELVLDDNFKLCNDSLCSCTIKLLGEIAIYDNGISTMGVLSIEITLGNPKENGGLDKEDVIIIFSHNGRELSSSGKSGWFEDELYEIQSMLPKNVYLKICINCNFSDYSPGGHGMFGDMMCFRNNKENYLKVKNKADFFLIQGMTHEFVQETYLCTEFLRRIPGTGYRG